MWYLKSKSGRRISSREDAVEKAQLTGYFKVEACKVCFVSSEIGRGSRLEEKLMSKLHYFDHPVSESWQGWWVDVFVWPSA